MFSVRVLPLLTLEVGMLQVGPQVASGDFQIFSDSELPGLPTT